MCDAAISALGAAGMHHMIINVYGRTSLTSEVNPFYESSVDKFNNLDILSLSITQCPMKSDHGVSACEL